MTFHAFLLFSLVVMIVASAGESLAATNGWVKVNSDRHSLKYAYVVPSPNALPSEKEMACTTRT